MNFFKNIFRSKTSENKKQKSITDYYSGEEFEVNITLEDVLKSDKTINILLDKITSKLGCSRTEMRFNDFGIFFIVFDDINGYRYIIDEASGNTHMNDFLDDIQFGRKEITPFDLRLRYVSKFPI